MPVIELEPRGTPGTNPRLLLVFGSISSPPICTRTYFAVRWVSLKVKSRSDQARRSPARRFLELEYDVKARATHLTPREIIRRLHHHRSAPQTHSGAKAKTPDLTTTTADALFANLEGVPERSRAFLRRVG